MGRGHHEAVAVVIVLVMRRRVRVRRSLIGAVDHESDMITASRFEAMVRVVSKVQILIKKESVVDNAADLEGVRTQG